MARQNIEEKLKELKSNLEESNWNFRKYIDSEVGVSLLENDEDTVIEILNAVRDFYATESLVLSCTEGSGVENFKERVKEENGTEEIRKTISELSKLHNLLLKLEFIYVYKLRNLIERQASSGNSESLFEFFSVRRRIEEIIFLWRDELTDFWYDFFEEWNYFEEWYYFKTHRWYFIRDLDYGFYAEDTIEYLINLTKFLSKWFSDHIDKLEKHMLSRNGMLHFVNIENTKVFHKNFPKSIKEALNETLYKKAFESYNISCYATIDYKGQKYITVNGIELTKKETVLQKFKEVLEELYKRKSKIAYISGSVRYYLKDEEQYIEYKDFVAQEGLNSDYNRMFTCCERKLFAKIREEFEYEICEIRDISEGNKLHLATTKTPCEMCQREINVNEDKIKVDTLDKNIMKKCDEKANEILESKSH